MEPLTQSGDAVRQVLRAIGAERIVERQPGEYDFEIGSVGGFARERKGKVRVSFFVAHDVRAAEAEWWIAELAPTPACEGSIAEVISSEDLTSIRLLIEAPFHEIDSVRLAASDATALKMDWARREDLCPQLLDALSSTGIVVPTTWRSVARTVYPIGRWSWGDQPFDPAAMYMFDVEDAVAGALGGQPRFALSHTGYGLGSYGLTLLTSSPAGSVVAFVQHSFGAAYADPLVERDAVNSTYTRLHLLLGEADSPHDDPRTPELMIVYSNLRGECSLIDLPAVRDGSSPEQATLKFDTESELFSTVAARLGVKAHIDSRQDVAW